MVQFENRSVTGLRLPKSISRNIQPNKGGVAVHYGGGAQHLTGKSHDACRLRFRSWQDYHMNNRGWADIAYTGGFCGHGVVMQGRWWDVRTAAQGTNDGN